MSDLDIFIEEADAKSAFVKFEDGEPVIGIYQKAEVVPDNFNKGEKVMQYTLEVDGVVKTFNSKSAKLARLIKKHEYGTELEIVRTGEGFKTLWYVYGPDDKKKAK